MRLVTSRRCSHLSAAVWLCYGFVHNTTNTPHHVPHHQHTHMTSKSGVDTTKTTNRYVGSTL